MADKRAQPDLLVSNIATRQHGAVTIRQLRSAGLSGDAVLGRMRARLRRQAQARGGPGASKPFRLRRQQ